MDLLKNIDISKLLNSDYIFEKTPPSNSLYLYLAVIFGAFIIAAVLSWYGLNKKIKQLPLYRKFRGRLFNFFLYIGVIGLFLIFCRLEGISYLGSRFFLLILFWIFIIWLVYLLNYRYRTMPKEMKNYFAKKDFEKYLPNKKVRKERKNER